MAAIEFNISEFRAAFPAFDDKGKYSDCRLQALWATATLYISDQNYGRLADNARAYAIQLMAAHLAFLEDMIESGETPAAINSSSIDAISVSLLSPRHNAMAMVVKSFRLRAKLDALLSMRAVGGWYVGGSCEASAFRKARGRF